MDFDSKVGWGSGRPGRREAIEQAGEGDWHRLFSSILFWEDLSEDV